MCLNNSVQRKPDEVSFLGEISDEGSSDSDSDSEFETIEEDNEIERKNPQSSGPRARNAEFGESENNRTDKESSELKESANVIENSSSTDADTTDTPEEASSIEKTEGKNELQDPSQLTSDSVGADKNTPVACDASSGNTGLSAVIDDSEVKNEQQDSSQPSSCSVDHEKGTLSVDESPTSDTEISAIAEKSGEKMTLDDDDSSAKREDCSNDEKSRVQDNAREYVEGSLEVKGTVADGCNDMEENVDEIKECSEQKEMNGRLEETKRENVNERNETELTNVQVSEFRNDQQSAEKDFSVKKTNSQEQLGEELPKEDETRKDQKMPLHEIEKQKANEVQLHGGGRQPDEDSKEQRREETREQQNSKNTELNNKQDKESEPANVTKDIGDELQTFEIENEVKERAVTGTDSQVASSQDSENSPTNEV